MKWKEIPEDYDITDPEPPHGEVVLLAYRYWSDGNWIYEARPYSTGRRVGRTSSVSCHGQATHWAVIEPPLEEEK